MAKNTYQEIRDFFPFEKENKIAEKLIKKWKNKPEKVHLFYDKLPEEPEYPLFISMAVITEDWPGFSEAVHGTVHEKGWNLAYESGISFIYNGIQLGIVSSVVKIENPSAMKKFRKDYKSIRKHIKNISKGSLTKRLLLTVESKRLEVYSEVIKIIKKKASKEELKKILGPEGEAFKFFASRTKAYLAERKAEDLAEQIIMNLRIQEKVKSSKGEIQIYIKNIKTTHEHLTAISVGVYEKDMLLKEILDAISYVLPDSRVVYNKEFTTPDGVLIARIEIEDREGKPYPEIYHKRIKKVLKRLHEKGRRESGEVSDTAKGYEHYLRAIIPRLLEEFRDSGSAQVFFSITKSSEFFLEFKIITITKKEDKEKKIQQITEGLEKIDGVNLLSTHHPKSYVDLIVIIFDVRVDLDKFESQTEIYRIIKEVFKKSIGNIRAFDQGMRKMDTVKLQSVLKKCEKIPPKKVKKIYYSLEDFWRMSASTGDIIDIITKIDEITNKFSGNIIKDYLNLRSGTAIIILYPRKRSFSGKLLELCSDCEITLSKIEIPDASILFGLVTKDGENLKEERIKQIISKLK